MIKPQEFRKEVILRLGHLPLIFDPSVWPTGVAENLWYQILSCYLNGPLSPVFCAKLAILISQQRKCPYALWWHSSFLYSQGCGPEILWYLLNSPKTEKKTSSLVLGATSHHPKKPYVWPDVNSTQENDLLNLCVQYFFSSQDVSLFMIKKTVGDLNFTYLHNLFSYLDLSLALLQKNERVVVQKDPHLQKTIKNLIGFEPRLRRIFTSSIISWGPPQNNTYCLGLEEENKIHASLEKIALPSFLKAYPTGICIASGNGLTFLFSNSHFDTCFEPSRRAMAQPLKSAVPVLSQQHLLEEIKKVYLTKKSFKRLAVPLSFENEDGGTTNKRIDFFCESLTSEANYFSGVLIVAHDVTHQTETALEHLDILESMNDSHFSLDNNWTILSTNRKHEELTKIPKEQQIGKNFLELFLSKPEHKKSLYWKKYHEAMRERKHVHFEDYYEPLDLWTSVDAYPKENGGLAIFCSDITKRKKTEVHVANEKLKLERIFSLSPAAMVLWRGPTHIFEMINTAYQNIFKGRVLQGKALLEACPELTYQPFRALLDNVLSTGQPVQGKEVLAKLKTQLGQPEEERYFDFTYSRIDDAQGRPYGVYNHAVDVTDRVTSKRELEASKEKLVTAIDALEQERGHREKFIASLTHDLRSPITATKLSAEMLAIKERSFERVQSTARRIILCMDRAERMIQDLLDASRIKAGNSIPITIQPARLDEIVSRVTVDANSDFGPRFCVENDSGKIDFYGDSSGIQRVLENLLSNAMKYGKPDGPITTRISSASGWLELSVHNEGGAISAEDQKTLFEPYKRTHAATKSGQKGWGIGLTLVKGIAEAHGGQAQVSSHPDHGSTFSIKIPQDARSASNIAP